MFSLKPSFCQLPHHAPTSLLSPRPIHFRAFGKPALVSLTNPSNLAYPKQKSSLPTLLALPQDSHHPSMSASLLLLRSHPSLFALSSPATSNQSKDWFKHPINLLHAYHSNLSTSLYSHRHWLSLKHHILLPGLLWQLPSDLLVFTNLRNLWSFLQCQQDHCSKMGLWSHWFPFESPLMPARYWGWQVFWGARPCLQLRSLYPSPPKGRKPYHPLQPQGLCAGFFFFILHFLSILLSSSPFNIVNSSSFFRRLSWKVTFCRSWFSLPFRVGWEFLLYIYEMGVKGGMIPFRNNTRNYS